MSSRILVLNGASSAGKTSLGRCLQQRLGAGWFMVGIDDLLRALLPFGDDPDLFQVRSNGAVYTTDAFKHAEVAWYAGVSALALRARGLVLDEVLLDGGASQARLQEAFAGSPLVWVGVVCDAEVGERRERERGDRVAGMHSEQRHRVHEGVRYDHVVDTSYLSPIQAADDVLAALREQGLLAP